MESKPCDKMIFLHNTESCKYDNIELHSSCLHLIFIPVDNDICIMGEVSVQVGSPEEGQPVQCFFFYGENFLFLTKKLRKK